MKKISILFPLVLLASSCVRQMEEPESAKIAGMWAVVEDNDFTNKYIKLMMIFSVAVLNIYGFIIFNIGLFIYLIRLKPFGVSYLYPLIPFNYKALLQFIIRKPKNHKKR